MKMMVSRNRNVLVQSVGGRDPVWTVRFLFPAGTRYFSILTLPRSVLGPNNRPI
jgi:hypothetical protein